MALISIEEVCEGVHLGLWRMDEEPEELLARFPHLCRLECPYKNSARQKEFYCVRALLLAMTDDPELRIDHAESGRPIVEGWQVSISHTKGYAALMLSKEKTVGVDIEYRSDRVAKIASHYIRPDEVADTTEQMLLLWCAKETLYKLHSDDNLGYFEMRAAGPPSEFPESEDVSLAREELMLENMKRGKQVMVHVTSAPDYVLTWAVGLTTQ